MRRLLAGVLAAGMSLTLAACSSGDGGTTGDTSPTATAGGELTIWSNEEVVDAVKAEAKKFADENGIEVNVQVHAKADMRDNVRQASTAGTPPDIFIGAHDWLGEMVKNGVVAPVDISSQLDSFTKVAQTAFTYDGQNFGVPFATENVALFRNPTLAPDAPKSIEDMATTGLALVKAKKATVAIGLQIGEKGDAYHMYPFQTGAGSYIFKRNDDGTYDTSQMGIAPPTGSKFGAGLAKLGKERALNANMSLDIAKEAFTDGKSPYWITGPWSTNDVQDSGVDFVVESIPTWEGGEPTRPFVGVQGFMVAAQAPNPAAAQTFLQSFAMTTEFMDALYAKVGLPPAWAESYEKVSSDPIIKAFAEYGSTGDPMPANPEMAFAWADLGLAQFRIVGGADPDTTLANAQTAIEKQIAANAGS
ncbi:MAG: sugar ABC transporter substrate-binding protein [Candidatus Nanopelagicales bacterium]